MVLRNMMRVHSFRILFFVVRQVLTSASSLEKVEKRHMFPHQTKGTEMWWRVCVRVCVRVST